MKSFAVKVPCPEVWDMLKVLAERQGIRIAGTRENAAELWFKLDTLGCEFVTSGNPGWYKANRGVEYISIEAAIAELTKPREKPIIIGGKTLSFPGDGSIIVGCQTISAEQCEELNRRRVAYHYFTRGIGNNWLTRVRGNSVETFGVIGPTWMRDSNTASDIRQCWGEEQLTEAEARQKFPAAFTEAH